MNSIKYVNKIDFLSNHWNMLSNISDKIKKELPVMDNANMKFKKISKYLGIVKYSYLNNWDVRGVMDEKSPNLIALSDKLSHMINKGRSHDIKPFLIRICFKGIKKQSQPNHFGNSKFLGYGHFRWNYQSYTLSENEIMRIIKYFEL